MDIYISVFVLTAYLKFTKLQYNFLLLSLQVRCSVVAGSLMRIKYLKQRSMAHLFSLFVRFMLVFENLFMIFKVASWTLTWKELTSWLSDCAVVFFMPY